MAIYQSNWAKGIEVVPVPQNAGQVVSRRFTYAVDTTNAQLGNNGDIIELAAIPPGCRVTDLIFDCDDLDDGTALVLDIGVMSGAWQDPAQDRTCGDEFFDGITTGQAGGVVRPTLQKAFEVAPSDSWRSIGVKAATAAGTDLAGTLGLTVFYEAASA